MRYIIYENDNVELDVPPGSKRSIKRLSEVQEEQRRAIFIDKDNIKYDSDNSTIIVKPYSPPTNRLRHHRHRSRHTHFHRGYANATIVDNTETMVYKREDPDTPMPDAKGLSQFWGSQAFKCPAKGSQEVDLPELRCKCHYKN